MRNHAPFSSNIAISNSHIATFVHFALILPFFYVQTVIFEYFSKFVRAFFCKRFLFI